MTKDATRLSKSKKTDTGASNDPDMTSDPKQSCMKHLLGFELADISSWGRFVRFMNAPRDAASLAVLRILFGILMLVDIPQERGMSNIDSNFGNPMLCRFPLFNFLQPLPVDWMYVVYLVMLAGAVGILLGAFYRLSCFLFVISYWYIFLLDKTTWNNHSYLYGLIGFQLLFFDTNRIWSIDSLRNPSLRNAHVPLWNYSLIRIQIFFVYFLAGLKKMDADWLFGYSMDTLAEHWVFDPFRLLLTDKQIDLFVVHISGFLLDLTVGFWLFLDATRPYAMVFCGSFHVMNSQIFSIGMFPYAMLATMLVFCYPDWPRSLTTRYLPVVLSSKLLPPSGCQQRSDHCLYTTAEDTAQQKSSIKTKLKSVDVKKSKSSSVRYVVDNPPRLRHHLACGFFIFYVATQLFLPYSHFLTKGYNNWTSGLYGYSWDMMVHNWHTQHVRLHLVDTQTGEEGYIATDLFTGPSQRWASHADMVKQLATCVSTSMTKHGIQEAVLHLDVWTSMNGRFQQRMWDPRVDIATAPWEPFREVAWALPLLTELSHWRDKVAEMEELLDKEEIDVTFVADFPGLHLENYVSEDLGNTSIEVLRGEVVVEILEKEQNVTLQEGEKMQVPAGQFHNVYTTSPHPSCYMYTFVNTTALEFSQTMDQFLDKHFGDKNLNVGTDERLIPDDVDLNMSDPMMSLVVGHLKEANAKIRKEKRTIVERAERFLKAKANIVQRTFRQTTKALGHILFGLDSVMITPVMSHRMETSHQQTHSSSEL